MERTYIKLSDSNKRKFHFIFNKKEKECIINEAMFFKNIYNEVPIDMLIGCSINKYLKIKMYKQVYLNIHEDVIAYKKHLINEFGFIRD